MTTPRADRGLALDGLARVIGVVIGPLFLISSGEFLGRFEPSG